MAFKITLNKLPPDIATLVIEKQAEMKISIQKNVSMEDALYALMRELVDFRLKNSAV